MSNFYRRFHDLHTFTPFLVLCFPWQAIRCCNSTIDISDSKGVSWVGSSALPSSRSIRIVGEEELKWEFLSVHSLPSLWQKTLSFSSRNYEEAGKRFVRFGSTEIRKTMANEASYDCLVSGVSLWVQVKTNDSLSSRHWLSLIAENRTPAWTQCLFAPCRKSAWWKIAITWEECTLAIC